MTAVHLPHAGATGAGGGWPEIRRVAVRIVPGAVLVLLVMSGLGYLLAHPLASAGFTHWEGGLDRWFVHHRSSGWNSVTNAASLFGDTPSAIGMSVLAFVALRLILHRWREAVLVAVSMIGEVGIFAATAKIVGRKRPTVPHLDGSPPTSSFPSGHTAAATTLYGVLAIIVCLYCARVVWRVLAVTLAVFIVASIGLSRLYRGMHFPTDVLGGVVLGALWIAITATVFLRHQSRPARSGVDG